MRRSVLVLLLACGACGPANEPAEPDAGGSSSAAESSSGETADPPATSTPTPTESGDPGESGTTVAATTVPDTTATETTATPTTGASECPQDVPGDWNRCFNGTSWDGSLCEWMGDPAGDQYVSCLQAALVDNGSVCIIAGCEDRCDCFAPPTTGTATVECMEGIIVDDTACVLYCGDGQICPDGMVCGYQICVWEPE